MAQLVRAPPCHGGGRRFESDLGRYSEDNDNLQADVAQLAEQLICNQQVIGSSPIIGSAIFLFEPLYLYSAGWSSLEARRAHNPKVEGSNPSPATHLPR